MAISDKTRKLLWGKSGNRCAICKTELVTKKEDNAEFNIGEECHIISSKPTGPRHVEGLLGYDQYENLLLLCRNHHKEIDELEDTYNEEVLRYLKTNHENWVRITLKNASEEISGNEKPLFLAQVTSGKVLYNIINGVYGYNTDYDESETQSEMDFIAYVLETIRNYGDLTGMSDPDSVSMAYDLRQLLEQIDKRGYMLFADRGNQPMFLGNPKSEDWTVATLILRRKENPEIVKVDMATGKQIL
ncbi:HNH endonuclease [Sphingobacterium sp. MYb382]|uniref:HNH endonuclease n=1 Tax=Sphingobacterium sp. MYb382 TaxID=2745278 RepID=UPI00309E28BA